MEVEIINRNRSFQEDLQLVCEMVSLLHSCLRLPLSCKIRILQDLNETVAYARSIVLTLLHKNCINEIYVSKNQMFPSSSKMPK